MTARRGLDWAAILARTGLEPPGYEEAVARATEISRLKKERAAKGSTKKSKSKKRK